MYGAAGGYSTLRWFASPPHLAHTRQNGGAVFGALSEKDMAVYISYNVLKFLSNTRLAQSVDSVWLLLYETTKKPNGRGFEPHGG